MKIRPQNALCQRPILLLIYRYKDSTVLAIGGVKKKLAEIVDHILIDEDGMIDIVSDHNILVLECKLSGREERKG
ncbi:hypothetical protein E2C01_033814 [Portunus trituberculatus]|uniref:Uncharacterized protein n=1 Tax=Portunus trituberculatus TaxID=210409 RepID=A0A5B7F528_PORTR|nr:hypothetical protein [Portunus trituberculatus]